ncbi:hypothetical protein Tco_0463284, partial [Tanacetum coccineum]
HPPPVTTITPVQQQTTPIPTPPITNVSPSVTTIVLDSLPAIVQRLSDLENQFEAWKQSDHSDAIEDLAQANIINEVKNRLPKFLPNAFSNFFNPRLKSMFDIYFRRIKLFLLNLLSHLPNPLTEQLNLFLN